MRKFGAFVNANSEAIFGTKPWVHQSDFNKIWFAIIFMGIIIVVLAAEVYEQCTKRNGISNKSSLESSANRKHNNIRVCARHFISND